jgi:lambda repressor-like predicted transcriptional regulator
MEQISVLRRRMKKAGVTLKSLSYLAGESEQTVCRILNQELNEKIHSAGNQLVKEANVELTKELFEAEHE